MTPGWLGGTVVTLLLAWIHTMWDRRSPTRLLKPPLFLLWLSVTTLRNGSAMMVDSIDRPPSSYRNVMWVTRKRPSGL